MKLFHKKTILALSLIACSGIQAKNFDVSQPQLIQSISDNHPNGVYFNTLNGQALGYIANDIQPGFTTVFTPPFTAQGSISIDNARGMIFNTYNSSPYAYVGCPGLSGNPVSIVELNGYSGNIVGSVTFNAFVPELFIEKSLNGKDYAYWVLWTGAGNGSVACLELSGTMTQVMDTIGVGNAPFYIGLNPADDNYLFVPNTLSSSLSVIELNGTAFVSSNPVTVGGTPCDICFATFPEGVYGYVANQASGMNIVKIDGGAVTVAGTISAQGPLFSIASTVIDENQYAYAYAGNNLFVYELSPGTCTLLNTIPTPNSNTPITKMAFNTVGRNTYGYLPLPGPNVVQLYLLNQEPFPTYSGNTGVISNLLNQINNDGCLASTQDVIEYLFLQEDPPLESYISQLAPAFKIAQYSLEKLDYALHKQLDTKLYQENMDNDLFILAGYDHMVQHGTRNYNRYRVDNYFQMFGGNYHFGDMKAMAAVGASESYLKVKPQAAHAKYPTVWGALGVMGRVNNWTLGIDGLFGYSFLHTSRKIGFLNQKARSNHNAWNLSVEGKVSYTAHDTNLLFKPYDTFGYIYGRELNYQEHGASGVNLNVKHENLSVFRNAFGLEFNAPKDSSVRGIFDMAWVFDYYFTNTSYKAAFVGTDVFGTFKTVQPARNYGRVNIGVEGGHNHFVWKLLYTGLFGTRFSENTATVDLGYRF